TPMPVSVSLSGVRAASSAGSASGPILASVSVACTRTNGSLSFNSAMRAGTASLAPGPKRPSAAAAWPRVRALGLLKSLIQSGTVLVGCRGVASDAGATLTPMIGERPQVGYGYRFGFRGPGQKPRQP